MVEFLSLFPYAINMFAELNWPSLIAGILSVVAFIPYIASILRLNTRPHLVTWTLWTILGALLAASYYAAGATLAAIVVPLVYIIGPAVVALLALKYGDYGYNFFDIACFLTATAAFLCWIITGDPTLTLYIALLVDFCGALPTIKKVALHPDSEDKTAWLLFLVANTINLLTIPAFTWELMAYPLYLFFIPFLVTILMFRKYKYFSIQ